ncbi:MAG: hypothetical protein J6M60_01365 [Clostridia bacterium]|nr:hypothetical protein [Clostridia bacterium]
MKKIFYKMMKRRYASGLEDRSFYERNVENFFSGHHATVILTKEAVLSHKKSDTEKKVVDFYDYKNVRKPCLAILKGNKVLIMSLDLNSVGKQKARTISFWEFCRDYVMADRSEVKVIC